MNIASKIAEVVGYKRVKFREYVDLALCMIAIVATVWAMDGLRRIKHEFDFTVGAISAALAVVCILLTSDRLVAVGVVSAFLTVRGVIGYLETGEAVVLPVVVVSAIILGFVIWQVKRKPAAKDGKL